MFLFPTGEGGIHLDTETCEVHSQRSSRQSLERDRRSHARSDDDLAVRNRSLAKSLLEFIMGHTTYMVKQAYRPHGAGSHVHTPIQKLDVSAYLIPTDGPESDGTLEWNHTLLEVISKPCEAPLCQNSCRVPQISS